MPDIPREEFSLAGAIAEPIGQRTVTAEQLSENLKIAPDKHGDEGHTPSYALNADLASHASAGHSVSITKATDETVNNSATLQDDDQLALPVVANEIWSFELVLFFKSSAVADLKLGWSLPAGTTMIWGELDTLAVAALTEASTPLIDGQGAATTAMTVLRGVIIVGSEDGNAILQWAQNTAEVSNTVVAANSHLIWTRIG